MNHSNPAPAVSQIIPKPFEHEPQSSRIARKKLQPGQPGTRKLLAEYGEKLVCVRYRYDAANAKENLGFLIRLPVLIWVLSA